MESNQHSLNLTSPPQSRHDEMRECAEAFHRQHPLVWKYFCYFTFQLIGRGFKNYSAAAVFQRIRWETNQAEVDQEKQFKINNNHIPFYARWFMDRHPEHEGFFRTRHQISKDTDAKGLPELGPTDFD